MMPSRGMGAVNPNKLPESRKRKLPAKGTPCQRNPKKMIRIN